MPNAYALAECRRLLNQSGCNAWRLTPKHIANRENIRVSDAAGRTAISLNRNRNKPEQWRAIIPAKNRDATPISIPLEQRDTPAQALSDGLAWIRQNPSRHKPGRPRPETGPNPPT